MPACAVIYIYDIPWIYHVSSLIPLQNIIFPLSPEPKGGDIYQYPANCCFLRLLPSVVLHHILVKIWIKKRYICILLHIASKFALSMYFKRVRVLGFTCTTCFRIWQLLIFNTFLLVKLQKLSSLYKHELFLIYLRIHKCDIKSQHFLMWLAFEKYRIFKDLLHSSVLSADNTFFQFPVTFFLLSQLLNLLILTIKSALQPFLKL